LRAIRASPSTSRQRRVLGPTRSKGVSVGFYRVQRANHARVLLKVVDSLSAAFAGPGELQTIAKTGGTLLEGVGGLLGLHETTCLTGHRISMASSPFDPFAAGFSALIAPLAPKDLASLRVEDRRLFIEADGGARPYRDSDFVLLSIIGSKREETRICYRFIL